MKKTPALALLLVAPLLYFLFLPEKTAPDTATSAMLVHQVEPVPTPRLYGFPLDSVKVLRSMIRKNENLSDILLKHNVSAKILTKLAQIPEELFDVRKLRADKPYTLIYGNDSLTTAKGFIYHPNPIDYVLLKMENDSLAVIPGKHPVDTAYHVIEGTIESSLYLAIQEAGGNPALANALSDIYAWDIDFFGLQKGDQFRLLYTTYHVHDTFAGMGQILASKFIHQDVPYYGFGYDQGGGWEYFDELGNSRRKAFLKAPLRFSRISSRFSYSRLHPVLKIRRPHYGVDYAAPKGTPVYAIGAGTVIKVGYSGGAGKMIKIRHNGNYTSGYLHLSGYASGIRSGTKVSQGQLIGYVGSTGLSTGPHLDFRFWKNGVPVNPLKVTVPSTGPICESLKEDYLIRKDLLMELIEEQWGKFAGQGHPEKTKQES